MLWSFYKQVVTAPELELQGSKRKRHLGLWFNWHLVTCVGIKPFPKHLENKDALQWSELVKVMEKLHSGDSFTSVSAWPFQNILEFCHSCSFLLSLSSPMFHQLWGPWTLFRTPPPPRALAVGAVLFSRASPNHVSWVPSKSLGPTCTIPPKTLQLKLDNNVQWLVNAHV